MRELEGRTVVTFESRRSREIGELVRRRGGTAVSAPSMREQPLDDCREALDLARRLKAGTVDVVVLLTGVGTRHLIEAIAPEMSGEAFASALRSCQVVVRGPKPLAVLRELAVTPEVRVPEPNTWRDLLEAIDAAFTVEGRVVAVQEYGAPNPELLEGLAARGAKVLRVPIYRWALPEDLAPLEAAIEVVVGGEADAVVFTSATQLDHVLRVAGTRSDAFRASLASMAVASIGPLCTTALEREGIRVDVEPEHSKMGHLIRALGEHLARDAGPSRP